jgi:hypothetical protein
MIWSSLRASPRVTLAALVLGSIPLGLMAPGCAPRAAGEREEDAIGEARQALTTCVTLQRGTLGEVADATIAAGVTYPGWGATTILRAGGSYESLLRFDLGSIPPGVIVESATLKLFTTSAVSGTSLFAHAVSVPWTEASSSFSALNQQFSKDTLGVMIPTTAYTMQSMPLKPATVQAWLDGTLANHGLLLETMVSQPVNAYKVTYFVNSEATTLAMRPALELCYSTIDHCETAPCQNGAACTSSLSGYTCACAPGFSGTDCEININDCAGSPCQNSGTCADGVNGYSCTCAAGYAGQNCETEIDECASAPCVNGGVCSDLVNAYSCACLPGFSGATCATNIDDCAGDPCQNGGTCSDGVNGYSCACAPGFSGPNCEVDIDECIGNACKNGSTCVDGVNGYSCACAPGFSGALCQTNIDECAGSPCQNGGTCSDGINGYSCTCAAGFSGQNCEVNINECAPNPCQNGGTCVDGVNGYTCQCPNGYGGATCSVPTGSPCIGGQSGVIAFDPDGAGPKASFNVFCDANTAGGGWTLLSNRRGGTTNVEACGTNLRSFFTSGCGNPNQIGYANSYALSAAQRAELKFTQMLIIQYTNAGVADTDDAYIMDISVDPFVNDNILHDTPVSRVCNINGAACDMTSVFFRYIGDYWYHSSQCYSSSSFDATYRGNYGLCHNGVQQSGSAGAYPSSSAYGNRNIYDETKLWAHPNVAASYQERIYVR